MDNLTQSRICVEKPLAHEENVMKNLSDRSNSHQHFKKLSAAFLTQKNVAQERNNHRLFCIIPKHCKKC